MDVDRRQCLTIGLTWRGAHGLGERDERSKARIAFDFLGHGLELGEGLGLVEVLPDAFDVLLSGHS
jgi:hypothetical protein